MIVVVMVVTVVVVAEVVVVVLVLVVRVLVVYVRVVRVFVLEVAVVTVVVHPPLIALLESSHILHVRSLRLLGRSSSYWPGWQTVSGVHSRSVLPYLGALDSNSSSAHSVEDAHTTAVFLVPGVMMCSPPPQLTGA